MVRVNDADIRILLCGRRAGSASYSKAVPGRAHLRRQRIAVEGSTGCSNAVAGDRAFEQISVAAWRRSPMPQLAPGMHTPLGYGQLEAEKVHA
jgi:hypothetical protein